MTWSRTVSSAAMVRAAGAGTRWRRVRAGLSTSWLPRSLRRSYARLADGVFVSDVPVIVGTFAAKLPTVKPCGAGRGRARPRVRRASAVCAGRRRRPGWHRAGTRVGDWLSTPSARRPVSTPFSAVANRSAIPASPVTISATNAELLARAVVTVGRRAPGTVLAGRRVPRRCRWWRTWRFVCWKAAAVSTPKIVGAHRNQLAVVYCGSRRSRRSASGESMMRQYGLVEITNASAASGRFSSGTIATAISAGPGQRCSAWPATAPTPACPLRDGIGAVPGIIACVYCGKPMRTNYKQRSAPLPRVLGRAPSHPPTCRSVAAATTDELAARLNAVGLTTGTRAPFDVKAVQWIPTRLPHPRPEPPTPMGRQCRRGRPPARLQRQRGLRLDQDRQTLHSTRHRQPAAHPLDRARRSPMRPPHHRIRTPQPAGRRTKSRARR